MITQLVTTYNRPSALARSLPQIAALGWPVLIVNDGGCDVTAIARQHGADVLTLPHNRGLAAAMNIGLSYLLADKSIEWVNYLQDDVDLAPHCRAGLDAAMSMGQGYPLITGHDAAEHAGVIANPQHGNWKLKHNCRATHMLATRDYWLSVMPIPTNKLHAPCREPGFPRGTGSNVDWWIASQAPQSIGMRGGHVLCVPGLVRTFLWKAEDSCWSNEQRAGADPELPATIVPVSA